MNSAVFLLPFATFAFSAASTPPQPRELLADVAPMVASARQDARLASPVLLQVGYRFGRALIGDAERLIHCPSLTTVVHLASDGIWIGRLDGAIQIGVTANGFDWRTMRQFLREQRQESREWTERAELSAAPSVSATTLARALIELGDAGFETSYMEPAWTSMRFADDSLDTAFPLRTLGRHSVAVILFKSWILVGLDDGTLERVSIRQWKKGRREVADILRRQRLAATQRGQQSYIEIAQGEWEERSLERTFHIDALARKLGYRGTDEGWVRPLLVIDAAEDRGWIEPR